MVGSRVLMKDEDIFWTLWRERVSMHSSDSSGHSLHLQLRSFSFRSFHAAPEKGRALHRSDCLDAAAVRWRTQILKGYRNLGSYVNVNPKNR